MAPSGSTRTLERRFLRNEPAIRLLGDDDRSVRSFNYSGLHSTRAKARFKDVTECVLPALVSPSSGIDESLDVCWIIQVIFDCNPVASINTEDRIVSANQRFESINISFLFGLKIIVNLLDDYCTNPIVFLEIFPWYYFWCLLCFAPGLRNAIRI